MATIKKGAVVQNRHGHYTKVIDVKEGFVFFNGWHLKKAEAEKRDNNNGNQPINIVAFERAIGGKVEAPKDTGNGGDEDGDDTTEVKASDAVKAFAAENDIDLSTVEGTGANGNIVKKDVEAAIKARDEETDEDDESDEDGDDS